MQLVLFMECDFVCEDLEGFLPFQNMHVGDVHTDHFSKIALKALVCNQQDNPSAYLTGLYGSMMAMYLYGSLNLHLHE
jgi:hypothetical protein